MKKNLPYFIVIAALTLLIIGVLSTGRENPGSLEAQKEAMEGALEGASESARRHAMDEFLADLRIEQRHYTRENKLLFQNRRSLVLQERLFFRNVPISEWIEHEILLEEGADVQKIAEAVSSFDRGVLSIEDIRAKRALPAG